MSDLRLKILSQRTQNAVRIQEDGEAFEYIPAQWKEDENWLDRWLGLTRQGLLRRNVSTGVVETIPQDVRGCMHPFNSTPNVMTDGKEIYVNFFLSPRGVWIGKVVINNFGDRVIQFYQALEGPVTGLLLERGAVYAVRQGKHPGDETIYTKLMNEPVDYLYASCIAYLRY